MKGSFIDFPSLFFHLLACRSDDLDSEFPHGAPDPRWACLSLSSPPANLSSLSFALFTSTQTWFAEFFFPHKNDTLHDTPSKILGFPTPDFEFSPFNRIDGWRMTPLVVLSPFSVLRPLEQSPLMSFTRYSGFRLFCSCRLSPNRKSDGFFCLPFLTSTGDFPKVGSLAFRSSYLRSLFPLKNV